MRRKCNKLLKQLKMLGGNRVPPTFGLGHGCRVRNIVIVGNHIPERLRDLARNTKRTNNHSAPERLAESRLLREENRQSRRTRLQRDIGAQFGERWKDEEIMPGEDALPVRTGNRREEGDVIPRKPLGSEGTELWFHRPAPDECQSYIVHLMERLEQRGEILEPDEPSEEQKAERFMFGMEDRSTFRKRILDNRMCR